MRKRRFAMLLALTAALLGGCASGPVEKNAQEAFQVEKMNQQLLVAAKELPQSAMLHFENGLEITGLGVTYDNRPTEFDGCYYFPAIEAMTGARVEIDWL